MIKKYGKSTLDHVLRYLPVIEYLKNHKKETDKILEVGANILGITQFYPFEITALDVDLYPDNQPHIKRVTCDAAKMPFNDNSYEYVISLDMLEHIEASAREAVITELLRTAGRAVILGVPCGHSARNHEQKYNNRYKKVFGKDNPFLQEHMKYAFPQVEEISAAVKNASEKLKKSISIKVKNNVNVYLWYYSRISNLPGNYLLLPLRGRFGLLLLFLWKHFNFGSCYRKIFTIEII
ncbi:MAG: hypothetical protein A2252_10715 [Elusimicrobia bacterium RIFOXYA2_FULL_39_19]|nr:MAG: hypothetical protein A2252_10715 [Elusimicrobia bacterium RIFOXYA2_FULL_39_19]